MAQYQVIDRRRNIDSVLAEVKDQLGEAKTMYLRKLAETVVENSPVDTGTYVTEHELAETRRAGGGNVSSHGKPRQQPDAQMKELGLDILNSQIKSVPENWDNLIMRNNSVHAPLVEYGGARMPVAYAPSTIAAIPDLPPIAFQNVSFDQRSDEVFIKAQFTPTSRRPSARGPDPQMFYMGLYNLLVCTTEDIGAGPGVDIAESIVETLDATKSATYGGIIVRIEYAEIGLSYPDPPHYYTPITISWYSYH